MWNSRPPPFMEKTILNFHFDYLKTLLTNGAKVASERRNVRTIFFSSNNFPFGRGITEWSETPYFHKGGPLRMVPKLPLSAEM